ncbi:Sin3 associated polypeptide p18-domain-containing protein [Chaetomium tenue]|uniref:Sin3 associated polypeptide p18-domain-containing protein n=1 Tax=Chaetomium tenue TaxID=1854479 RepID=A0ACB7PC93_9PEZI|nr:Sin3 associated polypeptide p18-domain-containing protein [Chaetomium globosum]
MSTPDLNRDASSPFLLRLFYRTGAYHRPDEFNAPTLPPHLTIHTWPTCTLSELSDHMLDASPAILPDPAIGTRLSFWLIYADTRGARTADSLPPRYVSKVLGTLVLGRGGPGAGPDEGVPDDEPDDADLTLADARFITGDFICCAILPPDELTGDVAPATSARMGRGVGVGEARSGGQDGAPLPFAGPSRQRDYAAPGGYRGGGRGSWGGGSRDGYGGGGRFRGRDEPFGRGGLRMPEGEWRRGDRLPDDPPDNGRWGR